MRNQHTDKFYGLSKPRGRFSDGTVGGLSLLSHHNNTQGRGPCLQLVSLLFCHKLFSLKKEPWSKEGRVARRERNGNNRIPFASLSLPFLSVLPHLTRHPIQPLPPPHLPFPPASPSPSSSFPPSFLLPRCLPFFSVRLSRHLFERSIPPLYAHRTLTVCGWTSASFLLFVLSLMPFTLEKSFLAAPNGPHDTLCQRSSVSKSIAGWRVRYPSLSRQARGSFLHLHAERGSGALKF